MALPGILIVFGAICGGFAMAGGHFPVLLQPSEFVVIIGAAIRTLITSAPGLMKKRVISTMGHLAGTQAVIGTLVASATSGAFLGTLLSYGVPSPTANKAEFQETHNRRYLSVIKAAGIASARGAAPPTAVEFGRKMIFTD